MKTQIEIKLRDALRKNVMWGKFPFLDVHPTPRITLSVGSLVRHQKISHHRFKNHICILNTCIRVKDRGTKIYASYMHVSGSSIMDKCNIVHHSHVYQDGYMHHTCVYQDQGSWIYVSWIYVSWIHAS